MAAAYAIIGDVHGCDAELGDLLDLVSARRGVARSLVFVGDLVDRGPAVLAVLRRVMALCARGDAVCVRGNHDDKLLRALRGGQVQTSNGLHTSLEQLSGLDGHQRQAIIGFLDGLPWQLQLDGGQLIVAHAGLPEALHGVDSRKARAFALYGDVSGQSGPDGRPHRRDWAASYAGRATVVYGHTPVSAAVWRGRTINIDTGCVFGGRLSALLYPEGEVLSVAARQTWWPAHDASPASHAMAPTAHQEPDDTAPHL